MSSYAERGLKCVDIGKGLELSLARGVLVPHPSLTPRRQSYSHPRWVLIQPFSSTDGVWGWLSFPVDCWFPGFVRMRAALHDAPGLQQPNGSHHCS